jgi:2-polyprenyl-3-methyl-5-hydroxy-6-metoxy-1,4-benzoquinol methylase
METAMTLLPDLSQRRLQPEVMDQPELDESRHLEALRSLERINFFSGSARILWPAVRELASPGQPLRVLDIASGAGDLPRNLARRAARAGLSVEIEGWDISSRAVEYARSAAARESLNVRHEVRDALNDELPADRDVFICSLFLHHLEEEQAVALLRRMCAAARRAVLINDLVRSRAGFLLAQLATRVLTRSPVVRVDGPRSVEAAFTEAEARALAERAGMSGAVVRRRWPFRYLLEWRRK